KETNARLSPKKDLALRRAACWGRSKFAQRSPYGSGSQLPSPDDGNHDLPKTAERSSDPPTRFRESSLSESVHPGLPEDVRSEHPARTNRVPSSFQSHDANAEGFQSIHPRQWPWILSARRSRSCPLAAENFQPLAIVFLFPPDCHR